MAKLSTLFGYQKIAKSSKLQGIIDGVDAKYAIDSELSDDELANVSAGISGHFARISCPNCGTVNNVNISASSFVCGGCKKSFPIDG